MNESQYILEAKSVSKFFGTITALENVDLNLSKLAINFGNIKIIEKGQLVSNYEEFEVAEYMKGEKIDLIVDLNIGKKNFTAYTMDLTKKYIEINADYRS